MSDLVVPKNVVESRTMSVRQLMSSRLYRVPEYQRAFDWTESHFQKLWDDIVWAYGEATFNEGDEAASHFLGAIVVQSPMDGSEEDREEVIDGQQRLASLSCLVSVIVGRVQSCVADQERRSDLVASLLPMVAETGGKARVANLLLNEETEFFREVVVGRNTATARQDYWGRMSLDRRPVAERLKLALTFFEERVDEFCAQEPDCAADRLANLSRVLRECLIVIKLTVHESKIAYRLFEALNFRGLRLSQADLLKNELLRRADAKGEKDAVGVSWREMTAELANHDRLDLPAFIQHEFISARDSVKASALFETVVEYLDDGRIEPCAYASDLARESQALTRIVNGSDDWSEHANKCLADLVDPLNVKFSVPLLLAGAERLATSPETFSSFAQVVRDFCFRYVTIGGATPSRLERVVGEASRRLRDDEPLQDVVEFLRAESPDKQFVERFETRAPGTNKLGFYVIERIENYLSMGQGVEVKRQSPTQHLEHIMPKKPGKGWEHVSGDDLYDDYVGRLGNLLVLEANINRSVKNKAIARKLKAKGKTLSYGKSSMKLPGEVSKYMVKQKWTFKSIEKRQKDMAKNFALKIWPLKLDIDA